MPTPHLLLMQRLHDEHASQLWSYCLRLTGHDRARAEDVVQETLLRAWRSASTLDASHGSVRAWLFTVARNIVIDEWRTPRARHELTVADVPERPSPEEDADALLLSWLVADALDRLSPDHRAVILECYYRGGPGGAGAPRRGGARGPGQSRAPDARGAPRRGRGGGGVTR